MLLIYMTDVGLNLQQQQTQKAKRNKSSLVAFRHYNDMHIQHHLYPKYMYTIKPIYIHDQTIAL